MARNVEIKARIDRVEDVLPRAVGLAGTQPIEILQDDTFFACATGRLKLRAFADGTGELIFYQRPDQAGPKTSFYLRTPTTDPDGLRRTLTLALGQAGRVRKHRLLLLVGRTRIHLDRVAGLGDFLELEVVLEDDEPVATGEAVARDLLARLDIGPDQLVATAYVDLLARPGATT